MNIFLKKGDLLSKSTVLFASYFVVYFLRFKLILFYNRVVYHFTSLFETLVSHTK